MRSFAKAGDTTTSSIEQFDTNVHIPVEQCFSPQSSTAFINWDRGISEGGLIRW